MQALFSGLIAIATAVALLPASNANAQTGIASHYSNLKVTASGRSYSAGDMVAAHRSLPFGTKLRVKNVRNGRSVVVTIVDRGPFIKGRIIDLSKGAASALGFSGLQKVHLSVIKKGNGRRGVRH
ncbi:septal ring lytic transglycosylase RlpA family protein [Hyphomicrobium sp. D-2]|uniref:septal ring lytic transglycosylase RlpA family protein n=1 Tax=Hyphomicrobium sp. D-2 TaxID=3041621 RepID=UPI0024587793|nr:septal ring lytic transglycosylase RlpA family protein [Hyphomicrobium sp. D-2]MDH4983756.1 septal ring lytic transglycosylase RlpA family protein [Hyphomicrobium sp. D-2]